MKKITADRCPEGGKHRWCDRANETELEVTLRCSRCRREFTVGKNPPRWRELTEGK